VAVSVVTLIELAQWDGPCHTPPKKGPRAAIPNELMPLCRASGDGAIALRAGQMTARSRVGVRVALSDSVD